MLKKALAAAALTMVSGVALAHGHRGHYYQPPARYYYPPAPRVIYRPVYRPAPVYVAPAPVYVAPAPVILPPPGIVIRLRFPL